MESIEKHIETDESILQDPLISKQQRRHVEQELQELKIYQSNHPEDHHDPSPLNHQAGRYQGRKYRTDTHDCLARPISP